MENAIDREEVCDSATLFSASQSWPRSRAIVTPDAANRALYIVVDSGSYYRSSMVFLDGANAAAVTDTTLRNIPGGDYEVTVVFNCFV